jgi:hypothetical protein
MNATTKQTIIESQPKNILVTGGGGFLGKAIARQLLAEGHRVASFSRRTYPELDALGISSLPVTSPMPMPSKRPFAAGMSFSTWLPRAGVWGNHRGLFPDQRDRHPQCHRRLPILPGAARWSTPAAPAWCLTAVTCRGWTSRSPTQPTTMHPTRRPRPWPNRRCCPPQTMR